MTYKLPSKLRRQYLSEKFNPLSENDLHEVLNELLTILPNSFHSARHWFGLFHELSCAVSQAQTILDINFSLNQTPQNEKKIAEFEKKILSNLLMHREKLIDIYLQSNFKYSMHAFENGILTQQLLAKKKISIPELSQLQVEENQIIREYRKFYNNLKTTNDQNSKPVTSLLGNLNHPNSCIRENAYKNYWNALFANEDRFQILFDKLLENRRTQAKIAGCSNYVEFAFTEMGRIDYSPQDCLQFRNSILKVVVPIIKNFANSQSQLTNTIDNKPWDSQFCSEFYSESPPANGNLSEMITIIEKVMHQIHPSFGKLFLELKKNNLIDILPRQGKSAGAYSTLFQESGVPFLFGNFGANRKDLFTFVHEFGHCLHGSAMSAIGNTLLRQPGMEFCEFASHGLELLLLPYLNQFWRSPKDAQKAKSQHLLQILQFWPFMSMMDAWQHEIYSSTKFVSAPERNEMWKNLSQKFQPHMNWDGVDKFQSLGWMSRHHVFTSPFYFIDYGIAQLGACQLWDLSNKNYEHAVSKYIQALSLGGQVSLPQLFKSMGFELNFGPELLDFLCQSLQQALKPPE